MEGTANLRHLDFFPIFFTVLRPEEYFSYKELHFHVSRGGLPSWLSTEFHYFMCFLHQDINFIWKVLISILFPDHGTLSVILRCSIGVRCMNE